MIERQQTISAGKPGFGSDKAAASLNRPIRFAGPPSDTYIPTFQVAQPAPVFPFTPGNPAMLPPESIVVLVPGMGAPASTMQYLYADFKQRGHRPYVIQVPQILTASRMDDGSAWLAGEIDTIRLAEAKPRLELIRNSLMQPNVSAKDVLKQFLKTDNSPLGQQTLALTSQLLMNTGFVQEITGLANLPQYASPLPPLFDKLSPNARETLTQVQNTLGQLRNKPAEQRLARVLEKYRQAFKHGMGVSDPLLAEKITNAVFDKLVPRVVLVGHSYGGAVSYKTLQDKAQSDQHNAIAVSYSLSSPVGGLLPNMPYLHTPLEAIYPATGDIQANSPVMRRMRNTPVPEDTTAISLCNPADGTIKPKATLMNETLPATLNMTVSPRKAGLLSLVDNRMQRFVNAIPVLNTAVNKVTNSWFMSDTSTHCGLLVNTNELWAPGGELEQRLFEKEESPAMLSRLLAPHNNEALQQSVLNGLEKYLGKNPEARSRFHVLKPELQQLAHTGLPFEGSSSARARSVLTLLATPVAPPNRVPILREAASSKPLPEPVSA